jgi:hypothetical protein
MAYLLSEARVAALSSLQGLRARYYPSTSQFDAIDRAMDLALSAGRAESRYLARDCLRNARSIDAVSRRRARAGGVDFLSDAASEMDPADLVAEPGPDSFEQLAWRGIYSAFVSQVEALTPHARRVLRGLERDESVEATAAALGLSLRQVKTIRAAIRPLASAAIAAGQA